MASPYPAGDREKVASRLPTVLQQELKVRAAELTLDIQDAVTSAVQEWRELPAATDPVDTTGAKSFSTWLPPGLYDQFTASCAERKVSYVQGLAQSVRWWLDTHPSPNVSLGRPPENPQRIIVCNQKGGVGKTAVSSGVAQAKAEDGEFLAQEINRGRRLVPADAEDLKEAEAAGALKIGDAEKLALSYAHKGLRVLLVDYDPQSHLTKQLGCQIIKPGAESLISHMCGEAEGDLRDLVVVIDDPRFGGRLHLLPGAYDGFLLDAKIAIHAMQKRGVQKEATLARALAPLEKYYDVIVVDCPPSLGLAMDAALYFGSRREGEPRKRSGVLVPVAADDSSADAYSMLAEQIAAIMVDLDIEVDYLGLVVNAYDSRRGYVATESLKEWVKLGESGDPAVLAVLPDLKEMREAVHVKKPLLTYAPRSLHAHTIRIIAGKCS
ncbi:ParA family protein [Streptomyces violascens]|uniref:ParA family protein n=1 Tax=Streptomyces violascens TaxID=67381 RepID=UPI0037A6E2C0